MRVIFFLFAFLVFSCNLKDRSRSAKDTVTEISASSPYMVVLGTTQDAGSPQIGCQKACCRDLFENPDKSRKVVSLGVVDPENDAVFLFEATPDMPAQIEELNSLANRPGTMPDAIFLTHAHIGHYSGLMYLGKEAINSDSTTVYSMPRMEAFLTNNGPWSQLVGNGNIRLANLQDGKEVVLTKNISVLPFLVPHRDEFSETVGYKIIGPSKSALFIPDIDKWQAWGKDIVRLVQEVDYAFLDATFYDGEEIGHRNIAEIPHPFVIETMSLFENLPKAEKNKIHFIHFNHTNPLLDTESSRYREMHSRDYNVSSFKQVLQL